MGKVGMRRKRSSDNARSRAWKAMRILRTFTRAQLMAVAEVTRANLDRFLPALERAGYLNRVRDKLNGHPAGHIVYRLLRDTGPDHPVPWKDGRVYDQNQKKAHGEPAQAGEVVSR